MRRLRFPETQLLMLEVSPSEGVEAAQLQSLRPWATLLLPLPSHARGVCDIHNKKALMHHCAVIKKKTFFKGFGKENRELLLIKPLALFLAHSRCSIKN